MVQYAETQTCKRAFLLNHFGEKFSSTSEDNGETCCSCCQNKNSLLMDVTIPCQKLMSAILRTQERFGTHYVIDVLLGSKQEKILKNNHQSLSVYGIGTEYSKTDWINLTQLLIGDGYLSKSEDFGVLSLTEKARKELFERSKIFLPFYPTGNIGKAPVEKVAKQLSAKDQLLFDELKKLRKNLAQEQDVPPYIIFGDKTLEQLVALKPLSDFELEDVYGLGEKKIEKYGDFIVRTIEDFLKK